MSTANVRFGSIVAGWGESGHARFNNQSFTVAEFESLIAVHTISADEMFAACFIPHHFFRYFDKAGKQVGQVEVYFCCAGVQQSNGSNVRLTEDQMLIADWGKLHSFITALGERTDVQCGGEA